MATVINVPRDERFGELGQGLTALTLLLMQKKKEKELNARADEAAKAISSTNDYDEAMAIYNSLPTEVKEKRGTIVRQAVLDRHPGFESIKGYDKSGAETTVVFRKGQDPTKVLTEKGVGLTGPAPAWGVDIPGIGVIPAPDEVTAKSISAKYAAKQQNAPVLSPPEVEIRLKSEQTEVDALKALAARDAAVEKQQPEHMVALAARAEQELKSDPVVAESGVQAALVNSKVLMDTEDVAARQYATAFGGSISSSGEIILSPGREFQFTKAKTVRNRLVARGLHPDTAFIYGERSGMLAILESGLEIPELASQVKTTKKALARDFPGFSASDLMTVTTVYKNNPAIPEYNPNKRKEEVIKSIPVKNMKGEIIGKLLVIKVDGNIIPVGTE